MLSANKVAIDLYNQSKEVLMTSDNYGFMVFRFSEWEDYITIDKATYHELYSNLCVKFRALIQYL